MRLIPKRFRKKNISSDIAEEFFKKVDNLPNREKKRAVFDLDNTILNGDIGDALFCRLKNLEKKKRVRSDGKPIDFTWSEYKDLMSTGNKEIAYRKITECMESVPEELIKNLTRELMNSDFSSLEHSGERVAIPCINLDIKEIIERLKKSGYKINIISASNSISVRVIAEEYLGLEKLSCFGMETQMVLSTKGKAILGGTVMEPVPVNKGKVELYRKRISDELPLITAGDSILDFPMLELVDNGGIVIWRGDEGSNLEKLKKIIGMRAEVFPVGLTGIEGRKL